MKIEKLTLHGFKSFADRTELLFDKGVTGIIGPNGSGKSNIVEAIRFVMGSRARALRAREAEALIFHGGDGLRPMPFAEVELALRDGDRRYVVRRRIDRAGGQEVTLNGKRATFRQIERALAGSGLGKSAHALVGQGEVSNILEAGPDALLERLEEAAGLRIVTLSLRETKQRLERARAHLDRLNEQLAGKLAEKARLQAEAEEAQRYEELQSELLRVRRGLFVARRESLRKEIASLEAKITSLQAERDSLQALALEDTRKQEELEAELTRLSERLSALQAEHASKEGQVRLLEQEKNHVSGELKRVGNELGRIEREIEELVRAAPPEEPVPPGDPEEEAVLQELADSLEEEVNAISKELKAREIEYNRQLSAYQLYIQAASRYEAELKEFRERQQKRSQWLERLAELKAKQKELSKKLELASGKKRKLEAKIEALINERHDLAARLRAAEAEYSRSERIVSSGADLAEGPRKVVGAAIPGVLGVVADLIHVPEGLEVAAEAALGPRMQWVLTKDEASLRAGVELLKSRGGRATFLAAELARPRTSDLREWLKLPGVVGAARDLFAIPGQNTLTKALFGDTIIVENLEIALSLARKKRRVRMVTLAGEVFEPLGSVSGGRRNKGGGERLALRNRLRQLEIEKRELAERVSQIDGLLQELQGALEELAIADVERELQDLNSEIKALERALEALPEGREPTPPEKVTEPDEAPLTELRQKLSETTAKLEEVRSRLELWRRYRNAYERYLLEKQYYAEKQEKLSELQGRRSELLAEQKRLQERLRDLEEQIARARQELAELGLESAREAYEAVKKRLDILKEERQENLRRISKIVTELDEARISLAKKTAVLEEVEREGANLPPGPHAEGSVRKLQMRLRQIERELEAIGPVNHRAAAVLKELEEKLGELERSAMEAAEAARRLEQESEELRGVYDTQLNDAYKTFRSRFAYYGKALLGGSADVTLDDAGLRLKLQPEGKRTRDLGLLSMGEKTMGALAFLFALAEVGEGSMPIAVLDEVDAPLDESNILRFIEFLRRFASERQYILVTHQKRSMEACDVLWGVTSTGGSSRVYSLRREEVESI